MSVDSTPPRWQNSAGRDDWGRQSYFQEPPEPESKRGFAVALLLLLAAGVLCAVGFVIVRVLFSDSPPAELPAFVTLPASSSATGTQPAGTVASVAPGEGQIAINPQQGYINTLVTVTGQGWWPGEAVFIFLRSQTEAGGPGYAYAAAVADDQGNFRAAFTFPNEMRWMGQAWADVIARGTRSELESIARFTLVAPTPTSTLPLPTARPTSESTTTPQVEATPTATPFSTSTPEVIITDWLGEYFANPALAGDPTFIRNDVTIDFNWGVGSPDPRIPPDQFSARWTRQHYFDGPYRFTISSDDGVRLWIDGRLVVDEWSDGVLEDHSVELVLSPGQHPLWLEYYEGYGGAMVRLSWRQILAPSATPTPSASPTIAPSPTAAPTDTPPPPTAPPLQPVPRRWKAEYYANPSLDGQPVSSGRESAVSFDWGAGSPGEGIPADNFSARWAGDIWLPNGSYRYYLRVDDGARVWIDGQVVIDAWHLTTGETYVIERDLWEGSHHFEIEYFEATGNASVHFWGEAAANLQDRP